MKFYIMQRNNEIIGSNDGSEKKGEKTIGNKFLAFIRFIKKYALISTTLIGLAAVFVVYVWKDSEGNKQKEEVIEMATIRLQEKNYELLTLLCKPLVWSIRSEMLRGNIEQVNIFTTDLVKEKNFQFIHLIEPFGTILISTNKRLEGQPAGTMFNTDILTTDSTIVRPAEDGKTLIVASPVMGYDKRLGTLILSYMSDEFHAEQALVH